MSNSAKTALIAGSIFIAILVIIPLAFGFASGWENWGRGTAWSGMMGPGMMTGLGGWPIMGILWLVIVGLIAWFIVSLVRSSGATAPGTTIAHDQALEVLKTRYARGEITKEEFEDKRRGLA